MTTRDNQLWLQMWRDHDIDFHQTAVNQLLQRFWLEREHACTGTVFVPMCGKSRDMLWLAQQGFEVIGVELSPVAVKAFFKESGLSVSRSRHQHFTEWCSGPIRILCGDYFLLTASDLGLIDRVYDRAALTALPSGLRTQYVTQLRQLIPPTAEVFLLTTEDFAEGTACVHEDIDEEIHELYAREFDVELTYRECIHRDNVQSNTVSTEFKLYEMVMKTK